MIIGQASVHTAGINWESVGAIAACVAVMMSALLWIFGRRDRKIADAAAKRDETARLANEDIRRDFTDSINHLSDVLMAKLETKEAVAQISVRLARLEGAAGSAARNSS